MNLDEDQTFGEAFPSPKVLKDQLVEITKHIKDRWAKVPGQTDPPIQFLAIVTQTPELKRKVRYDDDDDDYVDDEDYDVEGRDDDDDDDDEKDGKDDDDGTREPQEEFMLDDEEDLSRPSYLRLAGSEKSQQPKFWTRQFRPEDAADPDLTLTLVEKPDISYEQSHLALSYCWASSFDKARVNEYLPVKIRGLDGSSRPSRASGKTIRRAVRHAAAQGFMFLWIDQECIDQDDRDKKEAAVQKMDLIYRQSYVLSLLDIELDKDSFSDLLPFLRTGHSYTNDYQTKPRDGARPTYLAHQLTRTLELIASNSWFTRAWITQERLASSAQSGNDITWLMCTPTGDGSVLDGEIGMGIDMMGNLVADVIDRLGTADVSAISGLRNAFAKVMTAFKVPQDAARVRYIADAVRSRYNVLQAFKVLAGQGCSIPADKVTLTANCALWKWVLNTYDVEKNGWSYLACVWALAIYNGDASFFCQDPGCHDRGKDTRMLWAPLSTTKLAEMHCGDFVNGTSMSINNEGLCTTGWLWTKTRYIDLTSLQRQVEEREKEYLPVEHKGQTRETMRDKYQSFFWSLLRELTTSKNHDIAELVWRAVKCRIVSGFYGRHVFSVAGVPFSKILDPHTADYIATVESLGFADREEYFYCNGFETHHKNLVYHRNCGHPARKEADHVGCDPENEENVGVLLGEFEQLSGLAWIYEAVLQNGGLTVAVYRDEQSLSHEQWVAITDDLQDDHVFAQYREVRICRDGDRMDKKILNPDPFDVWLRPKLRKSHLDNPLCWTVDAQGGSDAGTRLVAKAKCNVLFDISKVEPRAYTLAWPEEFERDSW